MTHEALGLGAIVLIVMLGMITGTCVTVSEEAAQKARREHEARLVCIRSGATWLANGTCIRPETFLRPETPAP